MKIEKVINNNIICAFDENENEIVVMGRGIGFRVREGMEVAEHKIEKIFRLDNDSSIDRFKALIINMPAEHISVSAELIEYDKTVLDKKLNENIYITLTDHINFAVERYKQKMTFPNAMLREVRSFYRAEYLVGEYGIALIEKRLGIRLPVDEAASIALHIVNAEYGEAMRDTIDITGLIDRVVKMVQEYFSIELDESSLNYERFITHLKFLGQRIFCGELSKEQEVQFLQMIEQMYPEDMECSRKVRDYIKEKYGHHMTEDEVAYLAIHIRRIRR